MKLVYFSQPSCTTRPKVGNSPRRGADTDRRHLLVESLAEIKRQFGRSRRVLRASLRHRLDCAPLVQQVTQHHRGQSRHHRHRVPGANNLALIKKSLGITNLDGVRNLTGWRSCSRRSRRCTLRCCTPPARWCSTPCNIQVMIFINCYSIIIIIIIIIILNSVSTDLFLESGIQPQLRMTLTSSRTAREEH